ncbi:MAG TPA: plastocyanin/azurin family copper-binding protein [Anaerolineales bacterium]|nr:plastocyanin/azurin family copper-binding protein [Anaerolineales bacterium]
MRKTIMTFILVIFSLLVLAGCGGGGPEPVEATIALTEFAFSPDGIQVAPGAEVTLTLENDGALEHNFIVMNQGVNLTDWTDADQANIYFEQLALPAGQNTAVTFTAPSEPGAYQILCSIPSHLTQGMQGTLTVTAP